MTRAASTGALFDDAPASHDVEPLADGAAVLRGAASEIAARLLAAVDDVARCAPWRHMRTPGGRTMSVETTNCGALGWVSDTRGYRYTPDDPGDGRPWPAMPPVFDALARAAAARAGFGGFVPDACLINRYAPRTQLSLHQDRDERDLDAPIVSVSLGLPATFRFGGLRRTDPVVSVPLAHGDVVVWGGPARLRFHGVRPVVDAVHPATGAWRINLTLRKAG